MTMDKLDLQVAQTLPGYLAVKMAGEAARLAVETWQVAVTWHDPAINPKTGRRWDDASVLWDEYPSTWPDGSPLDWPTNDEVELAAATWTDATIQ